MSEEQSDRRVTYITWNLVAIGVFGALALGKVIPALANNPWSPILWIISLFIIAAMVWGIRKRHHRPTWLLPRIYLLVTAPAWLSLAVTGDMTSFRLGAIWLIIVPAILSSEWLNRLLGVPANPPSTNRSLC